MTLVLHLRLPKKITASWTVFFLFYINNTGNDDSSFLSAFLNFVLFCFSYQYFDLYVVLM